MPWDRPTLQQLRDRIAADFEIHSNGNPHLRGSLEFANANALAGAAHAMHGAIAFYARQLFDDTAEDEFILRRAEPFGLTLILAETAEGLVVVEGNNDAVIPAGTELQAPDQQVYMTDEAAVIALGNATVPVTAVEAGAVGNQPAGTVLSFTTPVDGVESTATVDVGGIAGGADQESMERFRTRFAERKANPPRGGSTHDYIAWAKQASVDVTRVWPYKHMNPARETEWGSVLLYIVADDLASPIPDAALVATVHDYIDQLSIRPVGAKNVYVAAPTGVPLDITVAKLVPNTAAVQAAVEAEIKDLLKREAQPGGTLHLSQIREAFSIATGETDHVLTVPNADVTLAGNEILVPGVITWPGE